MATEAVYIDLVEGSAPSNPASGRRRVYAKTDGVYERDDAGTEAGPIGSGGGGVGSILVAYKTADETVNGSAALQDDNELVVAVVANEVYDIRAVLMFDSGTTPDIKFAYTFPAAATIAWSQRGQNAAGTTIIGQDAVTTSDGPYDAGGAGAGSVRFATHHGVLVVGANAGNLTLRWAQNTSNASNTIVKAGSHLILTRLA